MSFKLDTIATPLADINELSTVVHLLDILGKQIPPDVKDEYDKAINIEQVIENLNEKKSPENKINYEENKIKINNAVTKKIEQGLLIAEKIFDNEDIIPNKEVIAGVIWSNTPAKFIDATGEAAHENNPSDILIMYAPKQNIYGVSRDWFGISLKASFKNTDIGQYNSSTCKFVGGVLHSMDNRLLGPECKKKTSDYIKVQTSVNNRKTQFDNILSKKYELEFKKTSGAKDTKPPTSSFLRNRWKAIKTENANEYKALNLKKLEMFNECRDIIINSLDLNELIEQGYTNRTFTKEISVGHIKTSIFSYLRLCPDDLKPNYIKASALNRNVVLELPGIYSYLPENVESLEKINAIYTCLGVDTINLSCGGKKSINFRIKLASQPPSSIKINGQNNPGVFSTVEGQQGGGKNDNFAEFFALIQEAIDNFIIEPSDDFNIKNYDENYDRVFIKLDFDDSILLSKIIREYFMYLHEINQSYRDLRQILSHTVGRGFDNEENIEFILDYLRQQQQEAKIRLEHPYTRGREEFCQIRGGNKIIKKQRKQHKSRKLHKSRKQYKSRKQRKSQKQHKSRKLHKSRKQHNSHKSIK